MIGGHEFRGYGAHADAYPCHYLTAAAAVGITDADVDTFVRRLDRVLTKCRQDRGKGEGVGEGGGGEGVGEGVGREGGVESVGDGAGEGERVGEEVGEEGGEHVGMGDGVEGGERKGEEAGVRVEEGSDSATEDEDDEEVKGGQNVNNVTKTSVAKGATPEYHVTKDSVTTDVAGCVTTVDVTTD